MPLGTLTLNFIVSFSVLTKCALEKQLSLVCLGAEPSLYPSLWHVPLVSGALGDSVLGAAMGHLHFVMVCTGINIAAVCCLGSWLQAAFLGLGSGCCWCHQEIGTPLSSWATWNPHPTAAWARAHRRLWEEYQVGHIPINGVTKLE